MYAGVATYRILNVLPSTGRIRHDSGCGSGGMGSMKGFVSMRGEAPSLGFVASSRIDLSRSRSFQGLRGAFPPQASFVPGSCHPCRMSVATDSLVGVSSDPCLGLAAGVPSEQHGPELASLFPLLCHAAVLFSGYRNSPSENVILGLMCHPRRRLRDGLKRGFRFGLCERCVCGL